MYDLMTSQPSLLSVTVKSAMIK